MLDDERGAVTVLTAVSLMMMVGLGAMAIEIGHSLAAHNALSRAAVAAAWTAATENGQPSAVADGNTVFALNFPAGTYGVTPTLSLSLNTTTGVATAQAGGSFSSMFGNLLTSSLLSVGGQATVQNTGGVVTILSSG